MYLHWSLCVWSSIIAAALVYPSSSCLNSRILGCSCNQSLEDRTFFFLRRSDKSERTSNPEFGKNKALFSCCERSLQDSTTASHNQAQLLDLRWEWMEMTRTWAKPQRQTPNLAKQAPASQQMYVVFLPLAIQSTQASVHCEPPQLLCYAVVVHSAAMRQSKQRNKQQAQQMNQTGNETLS